MNLPFVTGLSYLQLLVLGTIATSCLFWGRINVHLSYHAGDPIAAFSQASASVQATIIAGGLALVYMLFNEKIRYYATYTFWSERAAQDREREVKEKNDLLRSITAASAAVIASSSSRPTTASN